MPPDLADREVMLKPSIFISIALGLLFFAIFNLFYKLDTPVIQDCDEALYGVTALEMIQNHNYLVNTFENQVDYWNCKPPLAFYPAAAGFELFGPTPLGLRFFSPVLTFMTLLLTAAYCVRKGGYLFAACTVALLITSLNFIFNHNARTGDADALYVLLYVSSLLTILTFHKGYIKFYAASFIAALAFLTKSFHAATLFITIAGLYGLEHGISKKSLLRGLACAACALLPIGVWAALRYQYDGTLFFEKMLFTDTLRRAEQVIEHHQGYSFYYLKLIRNAWQPWFVVLACAAGLTLMFKKRLRPFERPFLSPQTLKHLLIVAVPFTLFSLSASKLSWYLYAVYPFIAMLLARCFISLYEHLPTEKKYTLAFAATLLIAFILGEKRVIDRIQENIADTRDTTQITMRNLVGEKREDLVYLFLADNNWSPRHILLAEMYPNLKLMAGRQKGYLKCSSPNKFLLDETLYAPYPSLPEGKR